ncbi:MAG: major capsid protein, partial [Aestuariivirga sp.]
GVPGLFKTLYAPADYIETVNRPGQRLYAKQWQKPNDKGVNVEFQMNALHYCTRPRVLMPLRRT